MRFYKIDVFYGKVYQKATNLLIRLLTRALSNMGLRKFFKKVFSSKSQKTLPQPRQNDLVFDVVALNIEANNQTELSQDIVNTLQKLIDAHGLEYVMVETPEVNSNSDTIQFERFEIFIPRRSMKITFDLMRELRDD